MSCRETCRKKNSEQVGQSVTKRPGRCLRVHLGEVTSEEERAKERRRTERQRESKKALPLMFACLPAPSGHLLSKPKEISSWGVEERKLKVRVCVYRLNLTVYCTVGKTFANLSFFFLSLSRAERTRYRYQWRRAEGVQRKTMEGLRGKDAKEEEKDKKRRFLAQPAGVHITQEKTRRIHSFRTLNKLLLLLLVLPPSPPSLAPKPCRCADEREEEAAPPLPLSLAGSSSFS